MVEGVSGEDLRRCILSIHLEVPEPQIVLESLSAVAADFQLGAASVEFELPGSGCPAILDPFNRRLKVYELCAADLGVSVAAASSMAEESIIGKVTAYALPGEDRLWEEMGFRQEAVIKGFYPDSMDAHLWAAYPNGARETCLKEEDHQAGVVVAEAKAPLVEPDLLAGFECRIASPDDAAEIAGLMAQTFPVYPSPISEHLISEQIRTEANHFRMVENALGEVVAVASAELDKERSSAEMTDCATRADQRGQGLMAYLLSRLEADLLRRFAISDLYTIARAEELGMNCVFSKLGYEYTGRLVNNCRMPNGWESMNVWCKNSAAARASIAPQR